MKARTTFTGSLIAAGLCAGVLATSTADAITYRVSTAERDRNVSGSSGGHAFWLPDNGSGTNIPNGRSSRFLFTNNSGRLTVSDDQTSARLTGTIQSVGKASSLWDVDIMFILGMDYDAYTHNHTDPNGDTHDGVEKRELYRNQYANRGGTVDPESWQYFYMDESNATLTGAAGGSYAGTTLDLFQRPNGDDYGKYVFQLGEGANGKNLNMGMSGWLGYTTAETGEQGSYRSYSRWGRSSRHGRYSRYDCGPQGYAGFGDINIDLEPIPEPLTAGLTLIGLGTLTLATRRRRAGDDIDTK